MQASETKAFFNSQLDSIKDDYVRDLEALSHEQLAAKPGGAARSAYDISYEVALINRRLAKRIRGETPETLADGWITCPEDAMAKEQMIESIKSSMDEVKAAWAATPDEELTREIVLPSGNKTNPLDLVFMAVYHTGYHDAQLNYIQALNGDSEMHWG